MNTFFYQDSKWLEVSASLRAGVLYVKMPRSKALLLVQILDAAGEDLLQKQIETSDKSCLFYGPATDWHEDLRTLETVLGKNPGESARLLLIETLQALRAGLRCHPAVDWILRVGGPAPREDESLRGLEPSSGCCSSGPCGSDSCSSGSEEILTI